MTSLWDFSVLGPLLARHRGHPVVLRSRAQRVVLAALLMRVDKTVDADELIDHLWGDQPPRAARATLQTYVMRLRRTLGDRKLVHTGLNGYSIRLEAEQLDLSRFRLLRQAAQRAEQRGDLAEEARLLNAALALWRGPVLADVPSQRPERIDADRLVEQRWEATERRNEVELRRGNHTTIMEDLRALVIEHPLRERFWAQLILALHRCGENAQALDAYQRARMVLAEELGVDPNPELRELHQKVLAGSGEPCTPKPGQTWLPPTVADFAGRAREVEILRAGLRSGERAWTITGPAGVGKTSLAVHVAHLVRGHFPDGQLYVNLHGTESAPTDVATALDRLLRGLGVHGTDVPTAIEDRVDAYRDMLARRRVLVVLDNAADEAQVRLLLPGTASSTALITSRLALAGLDAARVVPLDVLSTREALQLLRGAVGESRVAAETGAVTEIAHLCGRLPLALRVASARLIARPHWRLAQLADRLSDERRRFDELCVGDVDVRAGLAGSYESLDEPDRRAFRLLALLDAPDFPAWVAAPLLGVDLDLAENRVETLVDARLVGYAGRDDLGQARYRVHALFRLFGREVAAGEDHRAALRNLYDLWLRLADRAGHSLPHDLPFRDIGTCGSRLSETLAERLLGDPEAWFDAEWHSLRAAVDHSASLGLNQQARGLVMASAAFCDKRSHLDDWDRLNRVALSCAEDRSEAILLQQRGLLRVRQGRLPDARADFERARALFVSYGDVDDAGHACHGLGRVAPRTGAPGSGTRVLPAGAVTFHHHG